MSPPVRKGDGTGVVPQDIAEVRTGDGRVLFGGTTIPDNPVLLPESDDLTHFSGDTGSASINSDSPVVSDQPNNDLSLKFASGADNIYSLSGLPNYPQVDVTTTVSMFARSGEDSHRVFWSASGDAISGPSYGLVADFDSGSLGYIRRASDGNVGTFDATSANYTTGQFYTFDILHESDGSLTIDAYSDYSASADFTYTTTDDTFITSGSFDNQGITLRNFGSTEQVVDLWYNQS